MIKNLPNIILILCDTLGAKHMSLYGYERKTTPNLEKLIEDGWAVYTKCFAPAPWTTPSHASLFTGLYPSEHGTHGGNFFLNPNLNIIATLLQQVGYFTVAFSNNGMISRFFKFDTGFSQFWEMWHLFPLARFDEINKKIKNLNSRKERLLKVLNSFIQTKEDKYIKFLINSLWIKIYKLLWQKKYSVAWDATPFTKKTFKQLSKLLISTIPQPYFAFINLMQTHGKYNPPSPYRGKFSASLERPIFKKMYKSGEIWFEYYLTNPDWRDYLEYLKALYDEEVLFLDDILTNFIQFLKKQKEYDNTIIVITSDHGELFGEHGHVHHVFTTYNELIHVPLLIKYPKDYNIKGEINNLTQLHDLYSTFFDLADIPFPVPVSSKSLLSTEKRRVAVSQLLDINFKIKGLKKRNPDFIPKDFMQPMMSVITEDLWKITKRLDGHIEVYDLNKDLYETQDLSYDNHHSNKIAKLKELINLLEKATGFDKAAIKPN